MGDQLNIFGDSAGIVAEGEDKSHFWMCSSPFVESALFMVPRTDCAGSACLEVFDCDGARVNEIECSFPPGEVGSLELDQLMGSCKLESGIKHAYLRVS